MSDKDEVAAPFFFASHEPPSATAIDDDIYLTVTAADPEAPEELEKADIILSLDFARHVIAELSQAGAAATKTGAA